MLKITLVCVLFCNALYAQKSIFTEHAFLIDDKNTLTIYKDSISNKIVSVIRNKPDSDRYYLFQLCKVYNNRIKIATRFTINAGENDTLTQIGWINYGQIGLYRDFTRQTPFAYSFCDRKSKKIFYKSVLNFEPYEIRKIKFINRKPWVQVVIHTSPNSVTYGWFPPELQCMDIWNACVIN
jgi:hypothetical protein